MGSVHNALLKILYEAGYVSVNYANQREILAALSDYSEKRNEMLEYILLEEYI